MTGFSGTVYFAAGNSCSGSMLCEGLVGVMTGVFLLFGVLLIVVGYRKFVQGQASNQWPSVVGQVVFTNVERVWDTSSSDDRSDMNFRPIVKYQYKVGEQVFDSDQRDIAGSVHQTSDASKAQAEIERFPVGSPVTVYYDPKDPKTGVLERGAQGTIYWMIGGVIVSLVGLGLLRLFFAVTFSV